MSTGQRTRQGLASLSLTLAGSRLGSSAAHRRLAIGATGCGPPGASASRRRYATWPTQVETCNRHWTHWSTTVTSDRPWARLSAAVTNRRNLVAFVDRRDKRPTSACYRSAVVRKTGARSRLTRQSVQRQMPPARHVPRRIEPGPTARTGNVVKVPTLATCHLPGRGCGAPRSAGPRALVGERGSANREAHRDSYRAHMK